MCWKGKINDLRISKRDIIVYKVLRKKTLPNGMIFYSGPYKTHFEYIPNVVYKETIETIVDPVYIKTCGKNTIIINKGLHCFSSKSYLKLKLNPFTNVVFFRIAKNKCDARMGISSWLFEMADYPSCENVICKFRIPRGTKYFINDNKEIVTESLIFEKDLGTPKFSSNLYMQDK